MIEAIDQVLSNDCIHALRLHVSNVVVTRRTGSQVRLNQFDYEKWLHASATMKERFVCTCQSVGFRTSLVSISRRSRVASTI